VQPLQRRYLSEGSGEDGSAVGTNAIPTAGREEWQAEMHHDQLPHPSSLALSHARSPAETPLKPLLGG
jgi:hypothetical protein